MTTMSTGRAVLMAVFLVVATAATADIRHMALLERESRSHLEKFKAEMSRSTYLLPLGLSAKRLRPRPLTSLV